MALANAIEDAIGVPLGNPPFTAECVLRSIQAGRAAAAGVATPR